ncbi:MAG: hypothetical protein LAQ30_15760 [Acidobacteriia bacterium]|nr:hypothetical protein [Terriglobia bacterium]
MLAPQNVSIFLNNALKPTSVPVEIEADNPLPEAIRDMPDQVAGRFVELDASATHEIEAAWKRVMILNSTQVLYTFSFDGQSKRFTAQKR